jgi:3',5'-cyclic-nucleotide phosphodiesterase
MELRVLGCHGGETASHRTTAFLLDDRVSLDAGALTGQLALADQQRLDGIIVSHAHLDHVRDLATIADNRCQAGAAPLVVAGTAPTIAQLRAHFFNDVLWPDFTVIPSPGEPTIQLVEIPFEQPSELFGYRVTPIAVHHAIECAGFIIEDARGAVGFSGDTGPTSRFWQALNDQANLKALLMEVSFPSREAQLAAVSGHHTPTTLRADLAKYNAPADLPTLLFHIKPAFQAEVERECAKLTNVNLHVLSLGDHFIL